MTYTLEQAQTNFAQLIAEVDEGKEVVIQREGKPAVRLEIVEEARMSGPRIPGQYAGQFQYSDDWWKPLETDEELREYGFDIMIDGNSASPTDPLS